MHLNKILEQIKRHQYPYSRGVIVLEVRHTAEASGASLPVFISVSGSVSTASNTHNIPFQTLVLL